MFGTECSLKEFITNYVRECETERLSTEGRTAIDNAMKEASAWRERAPPPGGREHRLIFTCCISSWEAIASVAKSAKRCGSFGGSEAARAILPCAAALCAHARAAHSRMVPVTSRAARWLSDDDIVRFLQSLPNWRVATAAEPVAEDKALEEVTYVFVCVYYIVRFLQSQPVTEDKALEEVTYLFVYVYYIVRFLQSQPVTEDKALEEELHQAYSREAEILGSSLRDGAVARAEIIAEVAALADIALLCESMVDIALLCESMVGSLMIYRVCRSCIKYSREAEVLGSSLRDGAVARAEIIAEVAALADIALLCESMAWISSNVKSLPSLMSGIKLGDKLQADLAAAAAVFDEIQHKCLLLLHLEMRIQCFHYLGGPGGGAAPLAAALTSFHEHASPVLSLASRQYIMNGIGEMMSAGIVWCCVEERDANTRLPTLRHCLAALSLPHRGLTSATRYIQLLADPPEKIL
ncbi:unnamed protein product [Plutella xylostella]|uniref:Exocyst complex component Sec8 n=1 Tax=Plutella xylostella TaxID=51655 RepID=A0A8S4FFI0_PLUXY|nr:unnamed protein product [Plutella xylostella]